MLLNKTVYVDGGTALQLCAYDAEKLSFSAIWITMLVISLALNVFAVIGNVIVIIACFFQKNKPPFIIYILSLAFADLAYALVAPLYTYRYALEYFPNLVVNYGLIGGLSHRSTLIGNTFSSISSWLVVVLTIDRFILIRFPFQAKKLSTVKGACIAISVVILICCFTNAIWMYELFEVPVQVNPCNGQWTFPKQVVKEDGSIYIPIRYRKSYQSYAIVSAVLFLYALPTTIMTVSNVMILHRLRSNKVGEQSTARSKKRSAEKRLTKMIIIVNVIFMISNMPNIITRLLWKYSSPPIVSKVQVFAHFFLMINVASNFVVYSLFNKSLFTAILNFLKKLGCRQCMTNGWLVDESINDQSTTQA